jgi:hypothetical protein
MIPTAQAKAQQKLNASKSLIAKAARITRDTDARFATLLGLAVETVKSYRLGRRVEYLAADQRRALRQFIRLRLDQLEADYHDFCRL